jgi:uncharacterized membrane protein
MRYVTLVLVAVLLPATLVGAAVPPTGPTSGVADAVGGGEDAVLTTGVGTHSSVETADGHQPTETPISGRALHTLSLEAVEQPAETLPFDTAETEFHVTLSVTGDAEWTVTTEYRLDRPVERAAFLQYADKYENGTADGGPNIDVWRNAARVASNTTGRQMRITGVERTATMRDETTGVLQLTFGWSNFAERLDTQEFRVHDAFETPDGTWFPSLSANQRIVIKPPSESRITSSAYRLTNLSIQIDGPQRLTRKPIDMVYTLDEPTDTPTETPTATPTATDTSTPTVDTGPSTDDTPTETPPGEGDGDTLTFAAVVVAIAAVVVALFARQGGLTGGPVVSDPDEGSSGAGAETATESERSAGTESSTAEAETSTETDTATESTTAEEDDGVDMELLSDEERVEHLLEQNGGRMRQADIVSETGWSDAKVSQLLSAMAEEDRIDKLRLGRENLISFPEVDDLGSDDGGEE